MEEKRRTLKRRSSEEGLIMTLKERFVFAEQFQECIEAIKRGEAWEKEIQVNTATGEEWHSFAARKTKDPVTGKEAILVNEIDISRRKKLEESNEQKDAFLNMVSHEIRTPINGIIGFNSLLEETNLDREQRECCKRIARSSKLLLSQVNDLLDVVNISTGTLPLVSCYYILLFFLFCYLFYLFMTYLGNGLGVLATIIALHCRGSRTACEEKELNVHSPCGSGCTDGTFWRPEEVISGPDELCEQCY